MDLWKAYTEQGWSASSILGKKRTQETLQCMVLSSRSPAQKKLITWTNSRIWWPFNSMMLYGICYLHWPFKQSAPGWANVDPLPGVKLPNTLIFDYPTVAAISAFAAAQVGATTAQPGAGLAGGNGSSLVAEVMRLDGHFTRFEGRYRWWKCLLLYTLYMHVYVLKGNFGTPLEGRMTIPH